jgi:hypothetical protein
MSKIIEQIDYNINRLKEKKARLFSEIEVLTEVSPSMYQNFGKTVAELLKLEKEKVRLTENPLHEN